MLVFVCFMTLEGDNEVNVFIILPVKFSVPAFSITNINCSRYILAFNIHSRWFTLTGHVNRNTRTPAHFCSYLINSG